MPVTPMLAFEAVEDTITDGTLVIQTPNQIIPVGAVLVISTCNATVTGNVNGVLSITGAGGSNSFNVNAATSSRASAFDLGIHWLAVTTAIPALTNLTITYRHNSARKTAVGRAFQGLTGTLERGTGNDADGTDGSTSNGDQGASTTTATIPGASMGTTTNANDLIIAAFAYAVSTTVVTPGAGYTEDGQIVTQIAASDRGVFQEHREVNVTGTYAATADFAPASAWAGAMLAFPVTNAVVNPDVNAGADQTSLEPGTTVTLDASASTVGAGTFTSRQWVQTGGSPTVTLTNANTAVATFEAPYTLAGTTLTFTHTATNSTGGSDNDAMTVGMLAATERAVIGGVEVPMKLKTVP